MRKTFAIVLSAAALAACGAEIPWNPPPAMPTATPIATTTTAPSALATTVVETPAPAKLSMPELQKKAILAMSAAFRARDSKALAALFTQDVTVGTPSPEGMREVHGREALESSHAKLFQSVPDIWMTPTRVFQKGDVAIVEFSAGGTNTGPAMGGGPATSKQLGFRGASVLWFEADGLIKRDHTYIDDLTIAIQLGAVPTGKARDIPAAPTGDAQWMRATGSPDEDMLVDTAKAGWPTLLPKRDRAAFAASMTDDVVREDIASPRDYRGRAANLASFDKMTTMATDLKIAIDNAWAAGDFVILETTMSGTMKKGAAGALPATDKPFTVHSLDVDQFRGGKLAMASTYSNALEMLTHLGMIPKAP